MKINYSVTGSELEKLYYTYLSVNDDYVVFFPDEWEESVTLTIDSENDEVTFWEYDNSIYRNILDVENKLFSINSDHEIEIFDEEFALEFDLEELLRIL